MFWALKRLLTLLEGNSWFSELHENIFSFNSSLREKWFPSLKYNWWILEISFSAISRSWVCFKCSTSSQKRQAASPSVWKRKCLNSYMSEAPEKAYCSSVDKEQANVNIFIMQSWGAGLITGLEYTESQLRNIFLLLLFVFVELVWKPIFVLIFLLFSVMLRSIVHLDCSAATPGTICTQSGGLSPRTEAIGCREPRILHWTRQEPA